MTVLPTYSVVSALSARRRSSWLEERGLTVDPKRTNGAFTKGLLGDDIVEEVGAIRVSVPLSGGVCLASSRPLPQRLIGPDQAPAATKRTYSTRKIGNAAKIIGVDVARFGDDESALAFRQGIQLLPFRTYRNLDSNYGAALVARTRDEFGATPASLTILEASAPAGSTGSSALGRSPIGGWLRKKV